ncbi:hypothetical protein ACE193_17945 [Bernardetia sp. OM2101]|uniref:hypothetical protein n=1 Tax=Bernardetia sp. OM2101 TaxID=3344876 RepID=UPI0035CF1564
MNLNNLTNLINKLTEFGTSPKVEYEDKILELKILLVEIYAHFLNSDSSQLEDDKKDDDEIDPPNFDYNETRKIVESNFPDLGWYSTTLEINETWKESNLAIGDAIDDLTDIINDLLEIKWRFENTTEKKALWYFELLMRIHSEQHLVDLLKYLKDRE